MIEPSRAPRIGCVRIFQFRVLPGQERAYSDYIRDVVEPIDADAHGKDAFLDIITLIPDDARASQWTHARVFTFRDKAHRDALAERMASAAAAHDGSLERRDARKRYADTLRKQVATVDCTLSGSL